MAYTPILCVILGLMILVFGLSLDITGALSDWWKIRRGDEHLRAMKQLEKERKAAYEYEYRSNRGA